MHIVVVVVLVDVVIVDVPIPAVGQRGMVGVDADDPVVGFWGLAGGVHPQKGVADQGGPLFHQVGQKVPVVFVGIELNRVGRSVDQGPLGNVLSGVDTPPDVGHRTHLDGDPEDARIVARDGGGPVRCRRRRSTRRHRVDVGLDQQAVVLVGGDLLVGLRIVDIVEVGGVAFQPIHDPLRGGQLLHPGGVGRPKLQECLSPGNIITIHGVIVVVFSSAGVLVVATNAVVGIGRTGRERFCCCFFCRRYCCGGA
mmetsp:Transcript_19455/g.40068  ORF Transcript_19455/g.40068 Transcript_19455/m.40068 type:complete len:253 (-) Transcript_19455:40-798(-)